MKSTIMFSAVVLCIMVLLAVAAFLTQQFFEFSIPEASHPGKQAARPAVISEAVVDVPPGSAQLASRGTASPFAPSTPAVETAAAGQPPVPSQVATAPAEVVNLVGTAWVSDSTGKRRALELKSALKKGDNVETAADARMTIRFSDQSEIHVGSGTSLVLDEYLFDTTNPQTASFSARLVRGAFRVVTGLIVKVSPDKFNVRTRMATIGIRGCHVAFRSSEAGDDVMVLALTDKKSVAVTASKTGEPLINMLTGEALIGKPLETETFVLSEPQTMVSCQPGQEPEQKTFSEAEARLVMGDTVRHPSSPYELNQRPGEAVLRVLPQQKPQSENP